MFGARVARRCATKLFELMKTYITPNTEYMATVKSGILCGSNDGENLLNPIEEGKTGGGNDAPRRRVFF